MRTLNDSATNFALSRQNAPGLAKARSALGFLFPLCKALGFGLWTQPDGWDRLFPRQLVVGGKIGFHDLVPLRQLVISLLGKVVEHFVILFRGGGIRA